jgi:2-(1,2-epoxy-1,2-dihydrophenyl)acetyl-CoA isomerase
MAASCVRLEIAGPRATVTLANPAGRNAIGYDFCREFAEIGRQCAEAPDLRLVVVKAEGDMFSVGGNLREFMQWGEKAGDRVGASAQLLHEGVSRLHAGPAPVLLALNGMAAGAGFSLVCGADFVIAARSAAMTSAYTKMGLSPDGGGSWFLPRIVGFRKAFELMALNPVISAEEGLALGLVTEVVDDADLDAAVEAMASRLIALPGAALRRLKRLCRATEAHGLEEQLALEAELIAESASSTEALSAMRAFFERAKETKST